MQCSCGCLGAGQKRALDSLGLSLTGHCEPPIVVAGNQSQFFWREGRTLNL